MHSAGGCCLAAIFFFLFILAVRILVQMVLVVTHVFSHEVFSVCPSYTLCVGVVGISCGRRGYHRKAENVEENK